MRWGAREPYVRGKYMPELTQICKQVVGRSIRKGEPNSSVQTPVRGYTYSGLVSLHALRHPCLLRNRQQRARSCARISKIAIDRSCLEVSYPEAPQLTLRSIGMMAATISHFRREDQLRGSSGSSWPKATMSGPPSTCRSGESSLTISVELLIISKSSHLAM